jgi:hypothetical protein
MEATTVAQAGVQPGDTSKVRILADRISKLRNLRLLGDLIADLESLGTVNPVALGRHRQAHERLARELGL